MSKSKMTAAQRKNARKKAARARKRAEAEAGGTHVKSESGSSNEPQSADAMREDAAAANGVEIEYVAEAVPEAAGAQFGAVFERFAAMGHDDDAYYYADDEAGDAGDTADGASDEAAADEEAAEADMDAPKLSRKERKRQRLQSIGLLKQMVDRPEVVEVWDATAADPEFLVYLKSYRNTVQVPRHWCRKKRYLQGKRGVDKKPFELPDFIQATGIAKLREAYVEREEMKRLKQKSRERVQPKMGQMNINYSVLHDAFFKHQKKPDGMSVFGDMYYEGREFETNLTKTRPGVLSNELRSALGMSAGDPPPFLFNMQRVGPPPSYPNLKIPGLNAPIPSGCTYGFAPGQWGQPPVDDYRRPLYGDVFGTAPAVEPVAANVDRTLWGALAEADSDSDSEESSSEDSSEFSSDDDAVDMEEEPDAGGFSSTVSGMTSVTGISTPAHVDLRKTGLETPSSDRGDGFTVLKPMQSNVGDALMGTTHTYAIPSGNATTTAEGTVEMNLTKRKVDDDDDEAKLKKF